MSEFEQINAKLVIKNILKDLDDLKKFKVQNILILEYKKIHHHKPMYKFFPPSAKSILMIQPLAKHFHQWIKALKVILSKQLWNMVLIFECR